MTPPGAAACPQCGRPPIADAATGGLCPACLFAVAASMNEEVCPYQVVAPIEQDDHGITYLAERRAGGVPGFVALKLLEGETGEAVLARFHRLQAALARLRHPGAAKVLDAGSTPTGSVYVVSEYVAGTPLFELVSRQKLEPAAGAEIARQMTEAVGAAHAAGVMHLALDESKVKVSTTGGCRASITGFGLAVIVEGRAGDPAADLAALDILIRRLGL